MKPIIPSTLKRLFDSPLTGETRYADRRRQKPTDRPGCELLEPRVVLSHGGLVASTPLAIGYVGGALTSDLAELGVVPGLSKDIGRLCGIGSGSTQLATDIQKLQTDLQALAAKSGVTIADLNNLRSDEAAIRATGFRPDAAKLEAAISTLATAVASGADTAQAKADFDAVFAGSAVDQSVIDKTFADLVQTITDSKITAADLETIAADRKAIQTDLDAVQAQKGYGGRSGMLIGALANLGIVGGKGIGYGGRDYFGFDGRRSGSASTQLTTDLKKLQTDLQAVAAKSGVTVADLTGLQEDGKAIAASGFTPDATALQNAVDALARAVAAGTDTAQATAAFNALFSGSSVAQGVVDEALADLVQTISNSKVTIADLDAIAADRAAIKADLAALIPANATGVSVAAPPVAPTRGPGRRLGGGRRGR